MKGKTVMKKGKAVLALILTIALLCGLGFIAFVGIGENKDGSLSSVDLGLDLSGGVSITYGIVNENPTSEQIEDTVEKIRRRVEVYSTEAVVYPSGSLGDSRITVEIPGVSDADAILAELGQPGNLYFIREKDSAGNNNYGKYGIDSRGNLVQTLNDKTIEELMDDGSIVLEGTDVASAEAASSSNSYGQNVYVVRLTLTNDGAKKFAAATALAYEKGETIGIYYDGQIVSAPKVNAVISDGIAVIEGKDFTYEQVSSLATTIRIGGLSLQLEELRSNVVGAQLGQDAIATSIKAAILGFGLVVLFMLLMYRILGLSASLALSFYIFLEIILLDGLDITLTLPGIAGIILSVGMAVDANVLVFSRIKEEIADGKNVKEAIKSGYNKALSAIMDGNVTTMIAAIVLMLFGSGTIKGFAQTLALGICLSMITALFITRGISNTLYACGLKNEVLYGKAKGQKLLHIVEKRKISYGIAAVCIAIGVAAMVINGVGGKGAFNLSLDFAGGSSTAVTFDKAWTLQELDNEVVPKIRDAAGISSVQTQTVQGSNEVIFKTVTLDQDQRAAINDMLEKDYGIGSDHIETESISAVISTEMIRSAVLAMAIALAIMLVYIYIRFHDVRFGFSAILALCHDAMLVVTCYALTRIEVGSTFIAVVLTIIGYSINNTIVIFDRIRENNSRLSSKDGLEGMVNSSVSSTLTRSLFTSLTTFIMVFALYVFGVTDIRNFALPMMVGMVCGTFSSIFIASPLWYDMKKGLKNKAN